MTTPREVEEAAQAHVGPKVISETPYFEWDVNNFKAGAQWQRERDQLEIEGLKERANAWKNVAQGDLKNVQRIIRLEAAIEFVLKNYLDIPCEGPLNDGILVTGRIIAQQALKENE